MSDELNNLPPFYPGQKVVYITGKNMPKGTICVVDGSEKQKCCGAWLIFLKHDTRVKTSKNGVWNCGCCNKIYKDKNTLRAAWLATSFRPLQEQTAPLIKLIKVIEEQPVIAN